MEETLKSNNKDILICNIPRYYSSNDIYSLGRKIGIDKELYYGENITIRNLAEEFITLVYRLGREQKLIEVINTDEILYRDGLIEKLDIDDRKIIEVNIPSKTRNKKIEKYECKSILNISDIHMCNEEDLQRYKLQLKTDLIRNHEIDKLDYILICGDLTQIASKHEFNLAYEFIKEISERFSVKNEKIIIVPGNHDLDWESCKIAMNETSEIVDREVYRDKFNNFSKYFYKPLCGIEYPLDEKKQGILKILDDDKFIFLELNSSYSIDHINRQKSGINISSLYETLDKLLDDRKYDEYKKFAVFHHPISGKEQMNNEFLQILSQHKFTACFHGHIHQSEYNFSMYDMNIGINIIGSGTFGAPTKELIPGIPLQYNLIEISESSIVVKTRKKEKIDGAWMADARWGSKESPEPQYSIRI